ncbi:MAG TPA: prenyltransferase [Dehalococcoidia bacterium]|nr:prenyltransferase [Dehalococcoidia bacterium]
MVTASAGGLKTWFLETRPQFLILTPICVLVGVAAAAYDDFDLNPLHVILTLIGALLAHISVNVLNDYFDYRSGIDLAAKRTPFSGGSGILPAGLLKAQQVYLFGLASLIGVGAIGIYFTIEYGWKILPLGVAGMLVVYLYTTHITRNPLLCAIAPGLGFGPLMVVGTYFTQTGEYSVTAGLASLVPGFLVSNLLLLNQFPDVEADKVASRRHIPIAYGRRFSARVYAVLMAATYVSLAVAVGFRVLPLTALIGLLTLPLAVRTVMGALKNYDDMDKLMPSLGMNIQVILLTTLLTGVGILLGLLLPDSLR